MAAAVEVPSTIAEEKTVDNKHPESTSDIKDAKPDEASGANGSSKTKNDSDGNNSDFERYNDKPEKRERRDRGRNRPRKNGDKDVKDRGNGKFSGGRGGGRRGGRRGSFTKPRQNVKTRFDSRPESDDAEEIRRQVEFYFSDSNLPIDRFLLNEVGGSENKPVPLKVIHNFKRMRNFQPFSAVVEAVKKSDFLQVNDKDEVYRQKPIAAHFTLSVEDNDKLLTSDSMKRSVYVKGFGREGKDTAFDIEEFFKPYGIKGVRLRRHDNRTFKGSVFVEFVDEETAQGFLDLEEKPKFQGNELVIKRKKAYVDEKTEAIKNGEVRPRSPTRPYDRKQDRRNPRDNKRRRDNDDDKEAQEVDPDNWRERRNRFQDKRRKGNDGKAQEANGGDEEEKAEEKKAEEEPKPNETETEETADAEAGAEEVEAEVEAEPEASKED